jgi:hypothetical protein
VTLQETAFDFLTSCQTEGIFFHVAETIDHLREISRPLCDSLLTKKDIIQLCQPPSTTYIDQPLFKNIVPENNSSTCQAR